MPAVAPCHTFCRPSVPESLLLPRRPLHPVYCSMAAGQPLHHWCLKNCALVDDNLDLAVSVKLLSAMQLAECQSQARFVTLSVNSKADLDSLRATLGSIVDYMEADLTAFTSIRALTEAAGSGALRNIATAEVTVINLKGVPALPDFERPHRASMDQQSWSGIKMQGTA